MRGDPQHLTITRVSREFAALFPAPPAGLLATSRKNAGAALFRLGSIADARKRYTEALDLAAAALGPTHPQVADATFHIAETWYEEHEFDRAQKLAHNALIVLAGRDALDLHWRILDLLGRIQTAHQREAAAAFFGKIAVDLIQQARAEVAQLGNYKQDVYATTRGEAFRSLAGVLVNQGRIAEAEDILHRIRDEERLRLLPQRQSINAAVRRLEFSAPEATLLREYGRLTKLRCDLIDRPADNSSSEKGAGSPKLDAELESSERDLRSWLESVDRALDSTSFRKPSRIHEDLSVDVLQVPQPNLADSSLLIAVPTRSAVFLVLKIGQRVYRFETPVGQQAINRLVLAFRAALSTPDSPIDLLFASARDLYQIIIAPVEKALVELAVNSITFWLNGALRLIPPAALHDGERFLVERWSSKLYAPSPPQASLKSVPNHVAAFATCKGTQDLEPLKHSKREIKGIVRENDQEDGAMSGQRFFDEEFTAQMLTKALDNDYSIVHIASHFMLKPGSFRRSGLLLGTGTILQLDELLQHRVKGAHTVVLSACDTATSTVSEDGYSVDSLADCFLEQGAQTIMASLWTVADESTADFMIEFYRRLANEGGRPIALVLGEVQRRFLSGSASAEGSSGLRGISGIAEPGQSYRHPYYWSPFVVVDTVA
jgi:CHAT domain-containing protein